MDLRVYLLIFCIALSHVVLGQTLNRSTITYIGTVDLGSNVSVNGSPYMIPNQESPTVFVSGFEIPDTLHVLTLNTPNILTQFRIYPNPFREEIMIESQYFITGNGLSLFVYDILGELTWSRLNFTGGLIDLSSLPSGPYILKLETHGNGKRAFHKLIRE